MRTTLTIDNDVATMLEQLRKTRRSSFKALINEALRRGLLDIMAGPKSRTPFRTKSVDLGRVRVPSVDNIAEVLATTEGEPFR
jgi:hypothetical protein